jgi:hypothetical protein
MKLLVLLPILVVCCSIPFACIQVERRELKTGKALGFRKSQQILLAQDWKVLKEIMDMIRDM